MTGAVAATPAGPRALVTISDRYRYFWLKEVTGVDLSQHCARSLVGRWRNDLSFAHDRWRDAGMADGQLTMEVSFGPAKAFYFCGVTQPYVWRNNAHLAFMPDPLATEPKVYRSHGLTIEVVGLRRISFGETDLDTSDPNFIRTEYRTCRNWQFAHWAARYLELPAIGPNSTASNVRR